MACACIYVDTDNCSPTVHRVSFRCAKKQYRCGECGGTINPGDQYEYVFGIWGGSPDYHRTCLVCREIRDTLLCTWIYTEMWETLMNHWIENPSSIPWSDIGGLSIPARERVCAQIEELWEDEEDDD